MYSATAHNMDLKTHVIADLDTDLRKDIYGLKHGYTDFKNDIRTETRIHGQTCTD